MLWLFFIKAIAMEKTEYGIRQYYGGYVLCRNSL